MTNAGNVNINGGLTIGGQLFVKGGNLKIRSGNDDNATLESYILYSGWLENTSEAWSGNVNITAKNNIFLNTTNGAVNMNTLYLNKICLPKTGGGYTCKTSW